MEELKKALTWKVCCGCGKILIKGEMVWLSMAAHHILKILVNSKIQIVAKNCDKCVGYVEHIELLTKPIALQDEPIYLHNEEEIYSHCR